MTIEVLHRRSDEHDWAISSVRFTDEKGAAMVALDGYGEYRFRLVLDGFMTTALGPFSLNRLESIPDRLEVVMNATIHGG